MISYAQAKAIIESLYRDPFIVNDRLVEERINWWFFPIAFVGSQGVIVDKADGHFHQLGSAPSREDCFWGHDRGFKHETHDLLITHIEDRERTVTFLTELCLPYPSLDAARTTRKFPWSNPYMRFDAHRIVDALKADPIVFRNQSLHLAIPAFRAMTEDPCFEYEVRPNRCPNEECGV